MKGGEPWKREKNTILDCVLCYGKKGERRRRETERNGAAGWWWWWWRGRCSQTIETELLVEDITETAKSLKKLLVRF